MGFIPKYEITDKMLDIIIEITNNLTKLADIKVLEKMPKLKQTNLAKEINSLISIENSFLDEYELQSKITEKVFLNKDSDYLSYHNLNSAYNEIKVLDPLSLRDFMLINEIIEKKISVQAGKLRTKIDILFNIDNKKYNCTPINFIENYLEFLFDYLKNSNTIMLIKAIVFTFNLEVIRPFESGNEKTKFYWLKLLLASYSKKLIFAPINSKLLDNFKQYQEILQKAITENNLTNYIIFMLNIINIAIVELTAEYSDYSFYLSDQVISLMRVIDVYPMSLFDLMERLKLKSRDGFRKNYIIPALEAGLIGMTEPDKPTSKKQKYFKL